MNDNKRSPSLEELLQLKRAERPPAEFWNEFDRQLRAKQLAALVQRRPWWRTLSVGILAPRRLYFSLGATAVLALTFVSLRQDIPATSGPMQISSVPRPAAAGRIAAVPESTVVATQLPAAPVRSMTISENTPVLVAGSVNSVSVEEDFVSPDGAQRSATESPTLARSMESVKPAEERAVEEAATPSARFIAANLAAAQDSMGTTLLAEPRGFESRGMPMRVATVEPLQQMTPPGETRRSTRLLTAMALNSVSDSSVRTAERMASRISVEELYEQTHRFGTRRGGVNLKF